MRQIPEYVPALVPVPSDGSTAYVLRELSELPGEFLTPNEAEQEAVAVSNELRAAFTPLCEHAAALALPTTAQLDVSELLNGVKQLPIHRLPYGNEHIFAQFDHDNKSIRYNWDSFDEAEDLPKALREAAAQEGPKARIDPVAWTRYRDYMATLQPLTRKDIENAQHSRSFPTLHTGPRVPAPWRQLKDFLLVTNPHLPEEQVMKHVVMPIGEYGETFARNLALGVVAVQSRMQLCMQMQAEETARTHHDVLSIYTIRGAEAGKPSATSTLDTMHEGILSIAQVFTALTSEKVEGYDDPYDLISAVTEHGVVEDIARRMTAGIIGPTALKGCYFPGALEGDKMQPSLLFKRWLKEGIRKDLPHPPIRHTSEYAEAAEGRTSILAGKLCPVSNKGGGIRMQAEALIRVVRALADR